MMNNFDANF